MHCEPPAVQNAIAFFDGQNLFQHAKAAFGHHHPNYDPIKLHAAVCAQQSWRPTAVRFYTGIPDPNESEMWAGYWNNRIIAFKRQGVIVTTRKLRYRQVQDGSGNVRSVAQEKGVDVRMALDIVSLARKRQFDVAVLYSQDRDLEEVVSELRDIALEQRRWIKVACAFPSGPFATASRGIDKTDWIRMDRAFYDACTDPRDYRPRKFQTSN